MMSKDCRGAALPLSLLLLAGVLSLSVFALDAARMKSDAAQLKRATDAAALAVAQAAARAPDTDVQTLAESYVRSNLGTDAAQLSEDLRIQLSPVSNAEGKGYTVSASFVSAPLLSGASTQTVSVSSTAIARYQPLEVSLVLPNTSSENDSNLAVLRRLGRHFAENLVDSRENAWLALVPYSQAVNVSVELGSNGPGAEHALRLRQWAMASALRPVELTALFRSGYAGLTDRRIPDRRANLLCMYRGLNLGENYFWDQPPSGQFRVYYRADLPENGSPGAPAISWIGPNPTFGQANGANDTRWMVADKGCPHAPLLPLSNDLDKIGERLDQMSTRFNVNYAIAMGWAAMALAPAFQGSSGWGLQNDLPGEFQDGNSGSYKTIVMLVNTTGQRWFDSDSYNAYVGQSIDGGTGQGSGASDPVITRRFARLCDSFRQRKLRFFLIAVGQDEIPNNDLGASGTIDGASQFRRIAGPGLTNCAEDKGDITYLSGFDFVAREGTIQDRLDEILKDIRQKSTYVRLID
ncbi:pilus assembly protein [Uliginosibacterium sediminicola]|uniref:Pilus assembly protein n=1 Tax=Uliginosibacterium sediminicola TaxID=2024550 RepID=A0ABU9YZ64_9RHOO